MSVRFERFDSQIGDLTAIGLYDSGLLVVGGIELFDFTRVMEDREHYVIGTTIASARERCAEIGLDPFKFAISLERPEFFHGRQGFSVEFVGPTPRGGLVITMMRTLAVCDARGRSPHPSW